MLISDKDLNELEIEMNKLLSTGIFSEQLGVLIMKFTKRILHTKSYIKYPKEWKEMAASDAYIKLLKTLPKYDNSKAQSSREKHGQATNYQKGLYRFVQLICNSAINTTITKCIKEQNREVVINIDDFIEGGNDVCILS
jgi:hypothetical protein